MKIQSLPLLCLLLLVVAMQSCTKDKCEREITYQKAIPNYLSWEEIRADIKSESDREMVNPGKLYIYNDYLFVNEKREGIHVIDNSDPSNPTPISFMAIPGNLDLSVRNNTLYADNYTDLLAININDVRNVSLLKRVEDVYPHQGESSQGILTHYDYEEVTETIDCSSFGGDIGGPIFLESANLSTPAGGSVDEAGSVNQAGSVDGQGGSFARFTMYDNYLYIVDQWELKVFDISANDCPNFVQDIPLQNWNIETILYHEQKLFIGSNTGMDIYDLSDPANPTYISGYTHFTGCDPVYVSGDYAYVTIHEGPNCGGFTSLNQLDVLDISDIFNPILERSIEMDNPHGLSILDDHLYLCEGEFGLKVFDVSQPLELDRNQRAHLEGFDAYDVIGLSGNPNRLLLIGEDGFYQFDVSDPSNPEQLSLIRANR